MSCFQFYFYSILFCYVFPCHIRFTQVTCLCFTAAPHHHSPPLVFSFLVSSVQGEILTLTDTLRLAWSSCCSDFVGSGFCLLFSTAIALLYLFHSLDLLSSGSAALFVLLLLNKSSFSLISASGSSLHHVTHNPLPPVVTASLRTVNVHVNV